MGTSPSFIYPSLRIRTVNKTCLIDEEAIG